MPKFTSSYAARGQPAILCVLHLPIPASMDFLPMRTALRRLFRAKRWIDRDVEALCRLCGRSAIQFYRCRDEFLDQPRQRLRRKPEPSDARERLDAGFPGVGRASGAGFRASEVGERERRTRHGGQALNLERPTSNGGPRLRPHSLVGTLVPGDQRVQTPPEIRLFHPQTVTPS